MKQQSRRSFLQTALGAATAPVFIPANVLGADAPSRKITVGFIGMGGHGTHHNLKHYLKQPDAQVLMACDVDSNHLSRAKERIDTHYGNRDCATTKDFREVLARPDIDAVMISTMVGWTGSRFLKQKPDAS